MQQPAKLNYRIYQGSTFQETYRWESQTKVYETIANISKSAPCIITTQSNSQIPIGWRIRVVGVLGMKEINTPSEDNWHIPTYISGTEITLNQINSIGYTTYTSGGIIEYNEPVSLVGLNARMQIREDVDSTTVIHESTTQNGEIVIDQTYKTITLTIPASITQNFEFETAVYSMELYTAGGVVTPFISGNLTLIKEITR